ncbi:unnamed protein product [Heligmosomoides polygyrus]|uniref:MFS domain-containing protein n=1 Tax=Heligmosomoides polygyrus TaxID=6339 RepID=A0A183G4H3_HELPZ|nr:unnamed protein product [Heligmosomoides polygyrus]
MDQGRIRTFVYYEWLLGNDTGTEVANIYRACKEDAVSQHTVGVLTSGQLVERVGRRPLLLLTFFGLTVINCLISGFMYSFARTSITALGWGVVVCCCFFNLFFAAGPGPLCFFVPGELVNEKARSATYTWLNIVMNGVRSVLLAVYFPIQDALGGPLCYFVLFFPPCLLSVLLCFFFLPETTGLTPEEARKAMHKMPGFCGKGKMEEEEKAELNAA